MATKKVTKVEKTEEELLAEVDAKIAQSEVVEKDTVKKISKDTLDEANKRIYETYGLIGAVDMPERKEVIESAEHFVNGKVPAGFNQTYGDEITDVEDGQIAELTSTFNSIFNKEDGFRLFYKHIGNNVITALVPLKWAQNDPNVDHLYLQVMKCDARSYVLRPGNMKQQVEFFAKRLAKRLNYQKGR